VCLTLSVIFLAICLPLAPYSLLVDVEVEAIARFKGFEETKIDVLATLR
jgi:hypothetical protein